MFLKLPVSAQAVAVAVGTIGWFGDLLNLSDNLMHVMSSLQELVEYYQTHSLKESFKQLDTTLKYPYKSRERSTSRTFTRSPGNNLLNHPSKARPI